MGDDKERIVLGSGKLYVKEFTGSIPTNDTIETEENRLGWIQGGASLEYKPSFYTAKDDLGKVSKKVMTDEEAVLKGGVLTWNLPRLKKMLGTASVTENPTTGIRTLKIGGLGNYDGTKYVIHFLHEDDVDGNLRTTIVGSNEAGFTVSFLKDKETVINPEFKAEPHDTNGTLVILQEEYIPDATLATLTIGTLTFTPAFSSEVTEYTATATNATDVITATASDDEATVTIKLNDAAHISGEAATWIVGDNTVEVTVTNGIASEVYTVTVSKSET